MGVEPLTEACELAFAVARHGRESVPAIEAPAPMRSFLWVAQLPPRAITVAQRVIESDEQFRLRVAAHATEAKVGRTGYLWLTRPPGWETEYSMAGTQAGGTDSGSLPPVSPSPASRPQAPPAMQTPPARLAGADSSVAAPIPPRPAPAPSRSTIDPVSAPFSARGVEPSGLDQGAIGEELASLRNLVDRLADQRQDAPNVEPRSAQPLVAQPLDGRSVEDLERELVNARSERDIARADRHTATTRVGELERQIESFDHERALVKDSLTSAEKTTTAAVAERKTAEAERDRALDELSILTAERAAVDERVRVAEQAKLDIERELRELSTQWSTIRAEMDEIAEQRLKVEVELDRLSRERVDTIQDNVELIRRLTDELGRIEAERDMLAAQLDTARVRMTDTRSSLTEASSNISQQLDAADAAFSEMAETATSLSSGVAQATATRAELDGLISSATERPVAAVAPVAPAAPVAPVAAVAPAHADVFDNRLEISDVDEVVRAEPVVESTQAPSGDRALSSPVPSAPMIPPMPAVPTVDELPPMPAAPGFAEIPPMPAPPVFVSDSHDVASRGETAVDAAGLEPAAALEPIARSQVVLSADARLDPALAAREVVQTIDIVVLVDGDAVAEMGWPTHPLAERRAAIVEYLEGLAASTGAAAHVIFDRQLGDEQSRPESKAIRVELTLPQISASASIAMRIDDYPVEWPVTVVSDDAALASEAASRGVSQLGNGQLLDLFIGQ